MKRPRVRGFAAPAVSTMAVSAEASPDSAAPKGE